MGKKSIWMNDPLEKLNESIPKKNGRGGQFSARLGDVVERYDIIIKLTPAPEVSEEELVILGEAICGSALSPSFIKYLHEEILDCATGTESERIALSKRVERWSAAEKISLIESLRI